MTDIVAAFQRIVIVVLLTMILSELHNIAQLLRALAAMR